MTHELARNYSVRCSVDNSGDDSSGDDYLCNDLDWVGVEWNRIVTSGSGNVNSKSKVLV